MARANRYCCMCKIIQKFQFQYFKNDMLISMKLNTDMMPWFDGFSDVKPSSYDTSVFVTLYFIGILDHVQKFLFYFPLTKMFKMH